MDPTLKAASEALGFYFDSNGISFEKKKILIIQGAPLKYIKVFKDCEIDVICYHAAHSAQWETRQIQANSPLANSYDLVIQFASKSESETSVELSRGLNLLANDGHFIGVVHNRMGSTRYRKQLNDIFSDVEVTSKSKCRILTASADQQQKEIDYSHLESPTQIPGSDYFSKPGVYGGKKIDQGSLLLAQTLQGEHWSGFGADLGCGYGFLSGEILKTRHRVKDIWLYEVDSRALEMARLNLAEKVKLHPHWVDVTQNVPCERQLHWVIMNPPFHSGTSQDFALGQKFIEQAASILRPGSPLFMVANQHLPYEDTLFEHFRSVVKLKEENGFKCYKAIK